VPPEIIVFLEDSVFKCFGIGLDDLLDDLVVRVSTGILIIFIFSFFITFFVCVVEWV